MKHYIIRLDDACEKRSVANWDRIEQLLDQYDIKPIVGIIPFCQDPDMDGYERDENFWNRAREWQAKGWVMALHGYSHKFESEDPGLNPVNRYSEFAGVPLEIQAQKIRSGVAILKEQSIEPVIFFAPAHTFDGNTLEALEKNSTIRIISDTIANDVYCGYHGFTYIPQQSGRVRALPFKTVTFCYHPNTMKESDFRTLESFLQENRKYFMPVKLQQSNRKLSPYDKVLRKLYFSRRH